MAIILNDDICVQLKTYEKYYNSGLLKDKIAYFRVITFIDHFEVSVTFDNYEEYRLTLANFTRYPNRENNYQGFTLEEIVEYINDESGDCYYEVAEFYDALKHYDEYGPRR